MEYAMRDMSIGGVGVYSTDTAGIGTVLEVYPDGENMIQARVVRCVTNDDENNFQFPYILGCEWMGNLPESVLQHIRNSPEI